MKGGALRPRGRGALVIVPSRLSPLPHHSFSFLSRAPSACSLTGPSNLSWEDFKLQVPKTASPSWTAQPPPSCHHGNTREAPRLGGELYRFLFFCFLFFLFFFYFFSIFFVLFRDFSCDIFHSISPLEKRERNDSCEASLLKGIINILNDTDVIFN